MITDDFTIKDETKNGNNGTLGGAGYFAFDGTAYGSGTSDSDIYEPDYVPFHAIFRAPSVSPTAEATLISKMNAGSGARGVVIDVYLSLIYFFVSEDGTSQNGYSIPGKTVIDGEWHTLVGSITPGLISGALDGVPFSITITEQSIYQNTQPVRIQGYSTAGSGGKNVIDIASCGLGTQNFYMSSNWQNIIFEESGADHATISGATFSTNWVKDTGSEVYSRNFDKGFKLFTNGTESEDVLYPLTVDTATALALLPVGYSLKAVVPPLVFGDWEGWFKVPYDIELENSDENGKLFTGGVPNEIYYTDLVAGGFGPYIGYTDFGDFFKKFWVKKKPLVFNLTLDGDNLTLDGDNLTITEV